MSGLKPDRLLNWLKGWISFTDGLNTYLGGHSKVNLQPFWRRFIPGAPPSSVDLINPGIPFMAVLIPLLRVSWRGGQLPVLDFTGYHSQRHAVITVCAKCKVTAAYIPHFTLRNSSASESDVKEKKSEQEGEPPQGPAFTALHIYFRVSEFWNCMKRDEDNKGRALLVGTRNARG